MPGSHFSAGGIQRVGETYDTLDAFNAYTGAAGETKQLSAETYQIAQVIVGADYDNSGHVYVGNASIQAFKLEPGASLTLPIDQMAKVYVKFPAAATIFWLAVRDSQ